MSMTPERWKEIEELYHCLGRSNAERFETRSWLKATPEIRDIVRQLLLEEKPGILDRPAWEFETALLLARARYVPSWLERLGPIESKPA